MFYAQKLSCTFLILCLSVMPEWMNNEATGKHLITLDGEAVAEFCLGWDDAIANSSMDFGHPMFYDSIILADTPYGKNRFLKFRNPEIISRICKLYIAEYQYNCSKEIAQYELSTGETDSRTREQLSDSIQRHGNLFEHLPMNTENRFHGEEFGQDYYDDLASVAQSTFDESIYEEVWSFPMSGGLRNIYFSTVYPDRTLNLLLSAVREPSILRLSNGQGIGKLGAFELLKLICNNQGTLISQRSDDIRIFVKSHALFYSENRNPKYSNISDFILRRLALNILEKVGKIEDFEYIQLLGQNPPAELPPNSTMKSSDSAIPWSEVVATTISAIESRAAAASEP